MAALSSLLLVQPFLQTAIIEEIGHDGRSRMKFNGYFIDEKSHMIETLIAYIPLIFCQGTSQGTNLFAGRIYPHIHITRSSRNRMGIKHSIALTLQNTTRITCLSYFLIYIHCGFIQDTIAHHELVTQSKPDQQQVLVRSYSLRQLLDSIHRDSHQGLFLDEIEESLPVETFQCCSIQELLAFIKS